MSDMGVGLAAGLGIAEANKAYSGLVKLEPNMFLSILAKTETPLVLQASTKFFSYKDYQYLTNYKGINFFTKSTKPISLPSNVEVIQCKSISVPS